MSKVVAVVGASSNRNKFGNKAFRAFRNKGYTAIPVNPNESEVEGTKTVASVLDIPGELDMVTVYVPPEVGVRVIEDIARKGTRELWLNPGADDDAVVARARELGLEPILACSIMGIGDNPYKY
jgi:predicted CoA-binding protein